MFAHDGANTAFGKIGPTPGLPRCVSLTGWALLDHELWHLVSYRQRTGSPLVAVTRPYLRHVDGMGGVEMHRGAAGAPLSPKTTRIIHTATAAIASNKAKLTALWRFLSELDVKCLTGVRTRVLTPCWLGL
jgi:hypothetical protein